MVKLDVLFTGLRFRKFTTLRSRVAKTYSSPHSPCDSRQTFAVRSRTIESVARCAGTRTCFSSDDRPLTEGEGGGRKSM